MTNLQRFPHNGKRPFIKTMKKILSLIFFLATYYLLLTANVAPALAQGNGLGTAGVKVGAAWFVQDPQTWQDQTFGANPELMTAQRYGVFMVTNLANTIIAATGGTQTLAYDQNGKPYYTYQGGATSFLAGLVGNLYTNPPASSIEYLADLGSTLGLVKPAYAQGIGFNAFSPLLPLWKTFRNITYLGFIIVFVIVGFMVMFRKKIDPRTVVTIQEALPTIVLTLIVVTFSYALIGLLIDMVQFLNYLIVNIIVKKPGGIDFFVANDQRITTFFQQNIFNLIWDFNPSVEKLASGLSNVAFKGDVLIAKGLVDIGVKAIFVIALFFNMFKVFFMLLGSYIGIVLATLFAPLQALMGALPGGKNPLDWIRGLVANLLVFPATLTMLLIAYQFTAPQGAAWTSLNGSVVLQNFTWAPPFMGDWPAPGVGPLIGFGIIMAIPGVGNAIKQMMEVKEGGLAGEAEKSIKGGASFIPVVGGLMR